ncbi:MAG: hypothetical protein ABSA30_10270, partial [Candidatus Aminicenantales bacterium]
MKKFRRIRRLLVVAVILVLIAGGGFFAKSLVLRQIRSRLENSVHYARLRLSLLPDIRETALQFGTEIGGFRRNLDRFGGLPSQ